jgi:hypothetical protein
MNMAVRSKCLIPLSVNVVNEEKRDENYIMWDRGVTKWYINPKELTNHIVDYMKDAFEKCNVKVDNNSTKVIKIAMKKADFTQGAWTQGAAIQLKIDIPEKQYTEIYEANDNSPKSSMRAMAYAIHVDIWKIINDPVIQDYILCNAESIQSIKDQKEKDETSSKPLSQKLQELQTAFDKGLISKDEYQRSRQRLLKKY